MNMSFFDKDYFFILRTDNDRVPYLGPDKDTVAKIFMKEPLPVGSKPLIFTNTLWEVITAEKKIKPIDPPPEVLFNGTDLVVIERIAEKLSDLKIPNLLIQPAIFIDHKDVWHENYWFLGFAKGFDCWDREHSTYDPDPIDTEPPLYEVYNYSLNESLLQKTPLADRRLFKMEGTTDGKVVAHNSIVNLFRVKWVDIVPITDYGVNYP
jgi:hypothetical protein